MAAHQAPRPWDSPGKNTGVGCHLRELVQDYDRTSTGRMDYHYNFSPLPSVPTVKGPKMAANEGWGVGTRSKKEIHLSLLTLQISQPWWERQRLYRGQMMNIPRLDQKVLFQSTLWNCSYDSRRLEKLWSTLGISSRGRKEPARGGLKGPWGKQ